MSFSVTDRAFNRIAHVLSHEPQGSALRVSVLGGGCSGFQYKFEMTTSQENDDIVLEKQGTKVLVDAVSLPFIEEAQLDYVEDLVGSAFKIVNPNATSSCGCGTSFSM